MCMFCAAVPTVAALGLAARGEQKEKLKEALARGEPPPRSLVPAVKATAAALVVVVLAAVLYHVQISSA